MATMLTPAQSPKEETIDIDDLSDVPSDKIDDVDMQQGNSGNTEAASTSNTNISNTGKRRVYRYAGGRREGVSGRHIGSGNERNPSAKETGADRVVDQGKSVYSLPASTSERKLWIRLLER